MEGRWFAFVQPTFSGFRVIYLSLQPYALCFMDSRQPRTSSVSTATSWLPKMSRVFTWLCELIPI